MPEFGGPDPAPNDPSDSNIQPRHLHSVPAGTENSDLDGFTADAASLLPLPEEVIGLIVEAVASPAAAETLEWLHASAEARVELDTVREVVDGGDGGLDR